MTDNPIPGRPAGGRTAVRMAGFCSLAAGTSVLLAAGLLLAPTPAHAQVARVDLGTSGTYSVLGGQTVTNTGPSVLSADLGVSPGTAITGFPPGIVGGAIHAGDAVAAQAQSDLVIGYDDAAGRAPTGSIAGDLVGQTLTAGVYNSTGPIGLSGTLTLDGQGDPNSVFIFQIASTLITATASSVSLINGVDACNVYWQVGSSATLGTTSSFVGAIMALTSITVTTGTVVRGRALARNGQVSLDTNVFLSPDCDAAPPTTTTTTTEPTTTTTEPTTTTTEPTTTTTEPTTTTTESTTTESTTTESTTTELTSTGPTSTGPTTTGPTASRTTAPWTGRRPDRYAPGSSKLADTGADPALGPLLGAAALLFTLGGLLLLVGRTRRSRWDD